MLPGFVTAYKDKNKFIHLDFFPGLDDENNLIYKDIDLTKDIKIKYKTKKYVDGAMDFTFYDKRIYKLNCKLLDYNNNEYIDTIVIE